MIGKSFLPKSLFGRALLILVIPTLLIQGVGAIVFFDRHQDSITRFMANTLVGDTAFLVKQLKITPDRKKTMTISDFEAATNLEVYIDPPERLDPKTSIKRFEDFQKQLKIFIQEPFTLALIENNKTLQLKVQLEGQVLRIETSVKRLEMRTTYIFVVTVLAATFLFLMIAVVFLRNQLRPISRLAEAAENFGRGIDTPNFRPHGAAEVRKAAHAFMLMRERIKRQLRTRTDMLSGISHDLRTPLTRMKLQLAMLPQNEAIAELSDDVLQMEHMIQEYLDFARGEGGEEPQRINLRSALLELVKDYERQQAPVTLTASEDAMVELRMSASRRMLHNVVDNALRYGKRCDITLLRDRRYAEIIVDDAGTGIPENMREEVFRPFSRLDASRNSKTGGVGLGLTIARDIALSQGGTIALATSPLGGLRVSIKLPLSEDL